MDPSSVSNSCSGPMTADSSPLLLGQRASKSGRANGWHREELATIRPELDVDHASHLRDAWNSLDSIGV